MMDGKIDYNVECWYKPGCTLYTDRCHKTCHRYLEMNFLITNCGQPEASKYIKPIVPSEEDRAVFAKLNHIRHDIVDFVEKGENLYIVSRNLQNGKTTWALKIMYRYFDEIWCGNGFNVRGYFVYVPEFLTKLKTFSYRETKEFKTIDYILKHTDLVIWDDITSIDLSQNEQNTLCTYINQRVQKGKSNIYTGYTLGTKLECQVGELLSKRIQNSIIVEIMGESRH